MDIRSAGVSILIAAAAPAGADGPDPGIAAAAPDTPAPPGEKAEKVECSAGRLRKILGGQPWILNVCDRATLIVTADKGNSAKPFLFFLIPHRGGHRYAGVTIRFPDRSVTPPMPAAAAAARDELLALPPDEMAKLIAAARAPGEASPPAPDHEEEWIGAWRLRTDRKARTFGTVWINTGVIELAAVSIDGKVKISFRDNGARLSASLDTPLCAVGMRAPTYDGEARSEGTLAYFAAQASTLCPKHGYEAEIRSWLPDFPAALKAMKARAQVLYRPGPRCMDPTYDPDVAPPPHPPCGFPAPEIGENHADAQAW